MDKQYTRITHKTLKITGWQHFQRDRTKITADLLIDVNVNTLTLQLKTVQTGEISFDGKSLIDKLFAYLDSHVLGSAPSPTKFLYPSRDVMVWVGEPPDEQKLDDTPHQKLIELKWVEVFETQLGEALTRLV